MNEISLELVKEWASNFPTVSGVILGGGPPCQGVSSLNAGRRGADRDPRSHLYQKFVEVRDWVQQVFTWCPTFFLMESVASMGEADREAYTRAVKILPY